MTLSIIGLSALILLSKKMTPPITNVGYSEGFVFSKYS